MSATVRRNQPSGDRPIYVSKDLLEFDLRKVGQIQTSEKSGREIMGAAGDPVTTQPSPHGWGTGQAGTSGLLVSKMPTATDKLQLTV